MQKQLIFGLILSLFVLFGLRLTSGQALGSEQTLVVQPRLYNTYITSKLPLVHNKEIRVDLDLSSLSCWQKFGRRWKKVCKFPVVLGSEDQPTPRGVFPVFFKTTNAVNKNQTELGEAMDFIMRDDGNIQTRLAIHGWIWDPLKQRWGWGPTQGCIQLLRDDMHKLYKWAPLGIKVIIE